MKTERRHELETNQLADSLGHWIDHIQPYLRTIFGMLIAVVVLIFAILFVNRHSAEKAREGWDEYFQALGSINDPGRLGTSKLADVAEKYSGTSVAFWSTAVLADIDLNEGTDMLFKNKPVALETLRNAVEHYQEVLDGSREAALLQRATYGQARAHESLGDLDAARKQYASIPVKWPGSPFEAAAQQRAKDLDRRDTKEFYDWFVKQEPGKTMAKEPGVPGMKLPFDLDTIKSPSASSDGSTDSGPALPAASDDATSESQPEAGESRATEPAAAAPAATAPSATAPATAAPATTGPATEKPAAPAKTP
jgi:hypothetical protein